MTVHIPEAYHDLLTGPVVVTLVTLMPDGAAQATPVWCDFDGEHLLINTEASRQKATNLRERGSATVLAVDPRNPHRYLEVRGVVVGETVEGAEDHIDKLARFYTDYSAYFGDYVPEANRQTERRVIFSVRPDKINLQNDTVPSKKVLG